MVPGTRSELIDLYEEHNGVPPEEVLKEYSYGVRYMAFTSWVRRQVEGHRADRITAESTGAGQDQIRDEGEGDTPLHPEV